LWYKLSYWEITSRFISMKRRAPLWERIETHSRRKYT
jgi:hypothetical protein